MTTVEQTLVERGTRYGKFDGHAKISQGLKDFIMAQEGWQRLSPDQREALDMIMHKVARALNGEPNYDDTWRDICGYSQLVLDKITKTGIYAEPQS